MQIPKEKLELAKTRIGDSTADKIADMLHLEKYNSARKIACCPSPGHRDSTPSFSYYPDAHAFRCFGCGATYDIFDAYMATGLTFLEACEKVFEEAHVDCSFVERKAKTDRTYKYPKPVYADNKDTVYAYWQLRGISKETIDYLDIQQDIRGNTLFQYKDENDVLCAVKVRPSHAIRKGEKKCSWLVDENGLAYDTKHILFNRNKINPSQPLVITSGEGDCAACIECGVMNATSIPMGDGNTQWITEEWEFLNNFESIILVHDNDAAGEKLAEEVSRRLGEYRVKVCELPKVFEKDDEKFKVKDLNEVLHYFGKDSVIDAIANAKDTDIPSIIDYTKIQKFDMSEVDGFESGFTELDSAITRFYVGTTNIITGIAGSGKSSMLSTLICRSIEHGFKTFVYSGELSNPSLKNWVDSVHAGQRGINKYIGKNNKPYYRIRPEVYNAINSYYGGDLYFYKDSFDHKVSNLLHTMESVVRKFGVRTIVLDNLSSMDLENDDKNIWTKMDAFIRDVIEFSKRWQVIVILILHPKKLDAMRRMTLFDLQGVVSSVNLSHRVMSLYRVPDKEKAGIRGRNGEWAIEPCSADVMLDVLKDRFDSGTGKTVKLWYDVPSRRFYDSLANLGHSYAWDGNDYTGVPLPYPPQNITDLPFYDERGLTIA